MKFRHNDYSKHMPHLDFAYDAEYYPEDSELPDPQIDPFIPGARVPLDKVGVTGVDLPMKFKRRDGTIQELHVKASLYGSLDNPEAKGLNLSRFPIIMHEEIANHMSIEGLKGVLTKLQEKQGSKHVYCKLRFKYPWVQEALRTRQELDIQQYADDAGWSETQLKQDTFKVVEGIHLSHKKMLGYIFYDCILEAQWHEGEFKFFLTAEYIYSSTCPCSFELAQDAMVRRGKAANGHSQRSIGRISVEFNPDKHVVWIEDLIEMARKKVPTEVVIICKRRDEQAFAELNGSNLLFTEDASRLLYEGLDEMYDEGKIQDFSIVTEHIESLHPWSATAVVTKKKPGGLR
jgi:GTP cyclohydrolase I